MRALMMNFPAKWSDVPEGWRTCFELAWQSYLEGSTPIAAVIVDSLNNVVATGKSAVKAELSEVVVSHNEIAHAEVNALLSLDNRIHDKDKASAYTLYVNIEPCPLCMGAIYMSDLNKLEYAAKDRYGGSTNLLGTTPYLSRKQTEVRGPHEGLELLSIFIVVYCDVLRGIALPHVVHDEFAKDYPNVVGLAQSLAIQDSLKIRTLTSFEGVYEIVTTVMSES